MLAVWPYRPLGVLPLTDCGELTDSGVVKETCLLLLGCRVLNRTADDDNTVLSAEIFSASSASVCSGSSTDRISLPALVVVLTAFRTACIGNELFLGTLKVGRLVDSLSVFEASLIGVLLGV